MGRSGRRSSGSGLPPVRQIELSEKDRKKRLILLVILLAIAVVSLTVGMFSALNTEPGWTAVECTASVINCSNDLVFQYCYGQSERSATEEKKALTLLYSEATVDAYRIFYEEVLTLGTTVNEPIVVDHALYEALELINQSGNRCLYLAPVYAEYNRIFNSENEVEATDADPGQNPELVGYITELVGFANDPEMIRVELLGNDQAKLYVAPEYLTFAETNEITEFLDLGWMTNAFIVDYIADVVLNAGFANGYLVSYDGFTRNMDNRGERFGLSLFNRQKNDIHLAATMEYEQPLAIVYVRDFPMSTQDKYHYYPFHNGRIASAMIDPEDGMCKTASDCFVFSASDLSCAQLLLKTIPVFLTDSLDVASLDALKTQGISSIWFEGMTLYCNDSALEILLHEESGMPYSVQYKS